MKIKHPACDGISNQVRNILYCNIKNDFQEMESRMNSLIDLTKRFEITWDCMDCLAAVKQARRISNQIGVPV